MLRHVFWLTGAALSIAALAATAETPQAGEPFDEATIYFELNDTDEDLGIHGFLDGDEWRQVKVEDPNGRLLMTLTVRNRLARQGLTELFFESAEPDFSELAPAEFFNRFPEGTYGIEGRTLEGNKLESDVVVSHAMPEPAPNLRVNGIDAAEDCSAANLPVVSAPVTVTWDEVTQSHPTVGTPGVAVDVEEYQVFVELDDESAEVTASLPPSVTSYDVPDVFTALGSEFKVEVLTRGENGNQTATETCYVVQ